VLFPLPIVTSFVCCRRKYLIGTLLAGVFVALYGAIFLASITGYLGPSRGVLDDMSRARFTMLHKFFFPSVIIGLTLLWCVILMPRQAKSASALEAEVA